MTKINSILISLIILLLAHCEKEQESSARVELDTSEIKYATKFEFGQNGKLRVLEPWPGAQKPQDVELRKVPERIVVTSTTHLAYLELLGLEDKLVGFPGTGYISSKKINDRVASGAIKDIGVDGQLNLELLISTKPDLVIAFDMGGESTQLDKVKEVGIPVIYNSDFLETSALGRAEWIKFFGAIFGKSFEADSIFSEIAFTYESLKSLAANRDTKPTMFTGVLYGDIWYLPGGKNWSAQFFQDAGAEYIWAEDNNSGWLELSFESVYDKAQSADYWVGISTFNTLDELIAQEVRYQKFSAYGNDNVYSFNKAVGPGGGMDYFESGYARPDVVLGDLISIFHPDLMPDYQTTYYQKIQ